jgi:hypothetical protein
MPTKTLVSQNPPRNEDITRWPHTNRHNYGAHVQPRLKMTSVLSHRNCCTFTEVIVVMLLHNICQQKRKDAQLSLHSRRSHPIVARQTPWNRKRSGSALHSISSVESPWLLAGSLQYPPARAYVCPSIRPSIHRGESFVRSHDERGGSLFNSTRRGEGEGDTENPRPTAAPSTSLSLALVISKRSQKQRCQAGITHVTWTIKMYVFPVQQ